MKWKNVSPPSFFFNLFELPWARDEKYQDDNMTEVLQVNNLGFFFFLLLDRLIFKNSWNEKHPASHLWKRSLGILWSDCRGCRAPLLLGCTYCLVWIGLSVDGRGWKKSLMAEPSCRGCRCFLSFPLAPPPLLGAVDDLGSSQMRGHSSPKNVLRNTGPINLFCLALLGKKKKQTKPPNPKPTVVRIFFK